MGTVDGVQHAVKALYGTDPAQRQAANIWLTDFAGSQQAWDCVQLLEGGIDAEVQFFSTNILLNKVRKGWHTLQSDARIHLSSYLRSKLDDLLKDAAANKAVAQRLCLLVASIAARDGASQGADLLAYSLQHISHQTHSARLLCLDLLKDLAEEAEALPNRTKAAFLADIMQPQAAAVFQMLGQVLQSSVPQPGQEETIIKALACVQAWLGLGLQSADGTSSASPGALHTLQGTLFAAILSSVSVNGISVLNASAEVLGTLLDSEEGLTDAAADQAAMSAIVHALIGVQSQLQGGEVASARARLVAKTAAALAERSPEAVAEELPEAVQLAQLTLHCLSLGDRQVAEYAIDYLDSLSTVPLVERHAQLGQPLYSSLLQVLRPHMQYPVGFTSWDDWTDDDEEAFNRFRDQSLQEVLDISFGVLKADYLTFCGHLLQSSNSWQESEAALFGIRSIHHSALELAEPGSPDQSQGSAQGDQIRAFLTGLFRHLCTGQEQSGLLRQPWVLATTAKLIGNYSLWFGVLGGEDVPLIGALQLLIQALPVKEASATAAKAFHGMCARCVAKLSDNTLLSHLITAAHSSFQQASHEALDLDGRQSVCEGLARIAALLPAEEASQAGLMLINPFLQAGDVILRSSDAAHEAETLAGQLQLVAAVLGLYTSNGPIDAGANPAMSLLQAAQPILVRTGETPSLQNNAAVVTALCKVHQTGLLCMGSATHLVPGVCTALLNLFQSQQHPACLDVLADCVEFFGRGAGANSLFSQVLYVASSSAEPAFKAENLAGHQDLIAALYHLAGRYMLMAPAPAVASGALPSLFQWSVRAVRMWEADAARPVIVFLSRWIAPPPGSVLTSKDRQVMQDSLHSCMQQEGQGLVQAIALALVQSCPRSLLRALSVPLRALLTDPELGASAKSLAQQIMSSPQYAGLGGGQLDQDSCALFARLLLQSPTLPPARFSALVDDFGLLARGAATADVLLAYEL